ncbi:MAG TPA: hypothetical protein VH763_04580 [Gemmatimonadales bacterium]|jgi:hypothetical protein
MHLDEEQIQRVLHAELPQAAGEPVRSHLTECAACRSRVDEAQREEDRIFGLLRELDHPLPRIDDEASPVRSWRRAPWGRLAAAILVGILAAGAAYAASGAPLPKMLQRLIGWAVQAPTRKQSIAPPASNAPGRGIAVNAGDRLLIVFSTPTKDGLAIVSLTDDSDVEVRTLRGQASFTSDLHRLQIDNRTDSTRFQIRIPRGAAWIEIQVGGRRAFLMESGRVVTRAHPDPRGDYLLPLNGMPPIPP